MTGDEQVAMVRARLDHDERVARALLGATRMIPGDPDFYGTGGPAASAYWSHFTPEHMLERIERERKVLDVAVALDQLADPDATAYGTELLTAMARWAES